MITPYGSFGYDPSYYWEYQDPEAMIAKYEGGQPTVAPPREGLVEKACRFVKEQPVLAVGAVAVGILLLGK